jgi:membrane fusion protein (multidrug efflux system)
MGQYLSQGATAMSITQNTATWVTANFKETQLDRMKVGLPVDVKVDAYPGRVFKGSVQSLAGATGSKFALLPPDNASGNFVKVVQRVPVRIVLNDTAANNLLRAGMNTHVTVNLD